MHELGITECIIEHAREAAQKAGGTRVTELHLTVTPAADFTTESIEMYFGMLTQDDEYFRGARLAWETRPAAAQCLACGGDFEAAEPMPTCPQCGSNLVSLAAEAVMVQLTDVSVEREEDGA